MKYRRLLGIFVWFFFGYIVHYYQSQIQLEQRHVKNENSNSPKEEPHAFLVIFVLSSISNSERRQAIRDTWARNLSPSVKLFFVLNTAAISQITNNNLVDEQNTYGDLLMFYGIEDSFHSLTTTVLNSLVWATGRTFSSRVSSERSFGNFSYILKCDDDSYVRVENLEKDLRTIYVDTMLYLGFFDGRARVKRTGKYKELGWNICDTYIPYALGGGYVLGRGPVEFIAKNALYLRKYQNEDVSVGAWLANLNGLHREHEPRFDTEYLSRGCHQSYLITHKHDIKAMHKIYYNLQNTGLPCSKEYRTRLSYKYDWNTIPTKCCSRNNPVIP